MAKRARTAASDPWDDDEDMPPQKVPPGIHRSVYLEWRAGAAARLRDVRDNLRLLAPPTAAPPDSQLVGLRALGLLDFVRLRLDDAPPRRDLVAALVANYMQFYEWSYARGAFVKVSLDAFAEALRLPLPAEGRPAAPTDPPPGLDDPAVPAAAEWFIEAYILKPLRARAAAEGRPHKLPSDVEWALYRVKFGMAHRVDWSRLIWYLAEKEMVDLSKGKRPDWTCRHGAYLQRLIWVENPGLFQPALLGGDQNLRSELEPKMREVEARSKLHDARSKLLDLRTEHLESKSKELEERTVASKTLTELELLNRNLLTEKEVINSELVGVQGVLEEARKQVMKLDNGMKSMKSSNKVLFSRERKNNARLLHSRWALVTKEITSNGDLKNLRGELAELRDGMQKLESLNQVMFSRERESNGRLLDTRWALVTKEIKSNGDLKSLRGELAELRDGMQKLESLNQVMFSRERESNGRLLDTRWALVTKEIKSNGDLKSLRGELAELQDGMQKLESLNQVMFSRERESNGRLLDTRWALVTKEIKSNGDLKSLRGELAELQDGMQKLESLNQIMCSREREINDRLLDTRWALVTKEIKSNGDLKNFPGELAELQDGMQKLGSLNQVMCSREIESNDRLLDTRWAMVTKEIKSNGDLKSLRKELAELKDEMQKMESLNQVLVPKSVRDNNTVQAVRKELINGLDVATNGRAGIGIKRMGELDPKAFASACRPGLSQEETLILCSKWEAEVRNTEWHPFKVIMVDDQPTEIFLDDDDKLMELKQEHGDQIFALVKQALIERHRYNPSGGYPVKLLWNNKHSREATMEEVVQFMVKKCLNKRKR